MRARLPAPGVAADPQTAAASEQDATDRCTQEKTARMGGGCFDSSTMALCVKAFEDCGDGAITDDAACPLTYGCPK